MVVLNELERFRRLLKLAQKEINQGRPGAALEIIRPVTAEIESREGTLEWAELPLVMGAALTAQNNKEPALTYLNDALARIATVHDPPVDLK